MILGQMYTENVCIGIYGKKEENCSQQFQIIKSDAHIPAHYDEAL